MGELSQDETEINLAGSEFCPMPNLSQGAWVRDWERILQFPTLPDVAGIMVHPPTCLVVILEFGTQRRPDQTPDCSRSWDGVFHGRCPSQMLAEISFPGQLAQPPSAVRVL